MFTRVLRMIRVRSEIGGKARVEPPSEAVEISSSRMSRSSSFASTSVKPSSRVLRVISTACDQTFSAPRETRTDARRL